MRSRAACIALVVTAATLLAGCGGSNVGIAAKVNGRQITESQLSNFVTPKARGVNLGTRGGNLTPPKPFVLFILVRQELYRELLRKLGGMPSPGRMSALINSYVGNGTPERAVVALGVRGYTSSFAQEVLRYRALGSILDQRVRKGADIATAARKLHFTPVINPRYGTWDTKTMTISTAPNDGLPDYLHLQPTFGSVAAG